MVGLTTSIPPLHEALTAARRQEHATIDDALGRFGMTGVHGEPEVGVTTVIADAIRFGGYDSIRVDLEAATDQRSVAWSMAYGLARAVMGRSALGQMIARDIAPTWARHAYVDFAKTVGPRIAAFVLDEGRSPVVDVAEVLRAIATVTEQRVDPPVLWIDHLQAPLVGARHQVDVNDLLWNVRDAHQALELPIIVSGSRASSSVAHGEKAAFHGDGTWVSLTRPDLGVWQRTAGSLGDSAPPPAWVAQMVDITAGHPQSMLLALALSVEVPAWARTPLELWQAMLSLDAGHIARAMQHARTLHRLGADILSAVAGGIGPYEGATTKSGQMERQRAVRRLHVSGLITQPRPRIWEITNPLLAGRLRGAMPRTPGEARPPEASADEPPFDEMMNWALWDRLLTEHSAGATSARSDTAENRSRRDVRIDVMHLNDGELLDEAFSAYQNRTVEFPAAVRRDIASSLQSLQTRLIEGEPRATEAREQLRSFVLRFRMRTGGPRALRER